jgi:hypothetical protein
MWASPKTPREKVISEPDQADEHKLESARDWYAFSVPLFQHERTAFQGAKELCVTKGLWLAVVSA